MPSTAIPTVNFLELYANTSTHKRFVGIFLLFIFIFGFIFPTFRLISAQEIVKIISTISQDKVQNGDELFIEAYIESDLEIQNVYATIEPLGVKIDLKSKQTNDNKNIYEVRWIAHDLIPSVYTLTVSVVTTEGEIFFGENLEFSDPLVGVTSSGSVNYPDGGMKVLATSTIDASNSIYKTKIDSNREYIYGATFTAPAIVKKIKTSDLSVESSLTLDSGDDLVYPMAIDSTGTYAYFATFSSPSKVIKVNLATFTKVSTITLDTGENNAFSMVIDPSDSYLYVGTATSPGKVVKIDLSTFARDSVLNFSGAGYQDSVVDSVVDSTGSYAYFALKNSNTGIKLAKVDLSTFSSPTFISISGFPNESVGIAIDSNDDYIYIAEGNYAKLHKIDLGNFTLDSSINIGFTGVTEVMIDSDDKYLYVSNYDSNIYKVDLESMVTESSITLSDDCALESTSTTNSVMYCIISGSGTEAQKINNSFLGNIYATKLILSETADSISYFRFYSHEALGNARLGLYDSSKNLLWESSSVSNTKAGDWMTFNVVNGTPSTLSNLAAGTYWLGFQIDKTSPIPSYTAGSSGDGWYYTQSYGVFPISITGETTSAETYSVYAVYNHDGIIKNKTTLQLEEGGSTDAYSFYLSDQPISNVTITPVTDSQVSFSPTSITFSSSTYSTPQIITVSAVDDSAVEGTHSIDITHSVASSDAIYNGVNIGSIATSITDNDSGGVSAPVGSFDNFSLPANDPITGNVWFNINNEGLNTNSPLVDLSFIQGEKVTHMAVSNSSEFVESEKEVFKDNKKWHLCQWILIAGEDGSCEDGLYTVYVKFYNEFGRASEVFTQSILLEDGVVTDSNPDNLIDSDNDGLADYKELIYNSDKFNPDTDGDGYRDGLEIENCYSPLNTGKLDGCEKNNNTTKDFEDNIQSNSNITSYKVVPGDSLWSIAQEFLGSGVQYPKVIDWNKDIYPYIVQKVVLPGWVLDILE